MDIRKWRHFVIFLYLIVKIEALSSDSACKLSLNDNFGHPAPVFIKDGDFLSPTAATTDIYVRKSETILIACPGARRQVILRNIGSYTHEVEAECLWNSTFQVFEWTGSLEEITCNIHPSFTTQDTGKTCFEGNKLIRVGYALKNGFHPLYEACFDSNMYRTHYVNHTLRPKPKHIQSRSSTQQSRLKFQESDLFGKIKMAELYKIENQRARLDAILGRGMGAKYVTKKQFLSRGHLAPRADFILNAELRATFHYVNTAPQWMRGNAGDWARLEDSLRYRVNEYGYPVTVITGTHGVLTLPDAKGRLKEIYLSKDENNNKIVPVPLYFYKLVYEPRKKLAAAFVQINSSYYNQTAIKELSFCDEDCDRHAFLKWSSRDQTHSFCCDYHMLAAVATNLPKLQVDGIFYE